MASTTTTVAPSSGANRPCIGIFSVVIIIFEIFLQLFSIFKIVDRRITSEPLATHCAFVKPASVMKRRETLDIITSRTTHTILKHNGCRLQASNIIIQTVNLGNLDVNVWATPLHYGTKDELLQQLLLERKMTRLEKARRRLEYS